jgi:hypothetical protein
MLDAVKLTSVPPGERLYPQLFHWRWICRRNYNDNVRQAVMIAKQVDRPVKVVWSREETTRHGYYRPMRVARIQAGLGPDGLPVAWINRDIGVDQNPPQDTAQTVRGLRQILLHKGVTSQSTSQIRESAAWRSGHNVGGELERNQYRVAFSAFCPTMMRPASGLSG